MWAQYLRGGFRAALSIRAIIDRLRVNLSLTVVVAALTVILLVIGGVGLVGLVIGVEVCALDGPGCPSSSIDQQ